ncbi:MAG: hypothetical protein JW709_03795 [Sedimentisphaerales bacterium]|nr:hypothetical protein [Sedimentisphaerales bacterium]
MYGDPLQPGAQVRFCLADVMCPDRQDLRAHLTERLRLSGRIVLLSDMGEKRNFFAVVDVPGISAPLVVPVDRIESPRASLDDVSETIKRARE